MLIEVRPGEGGEDAERFADECFDMMLAVAARRELVPRSIMRDARIRTFAAVSDSSLLDRAGTHRVQRIPKGAAARHTSTATIVVLDDEVARSS